MNWRQVCAIAGKLPEVTVDRWWGTPGLKVKGKGFARLKEDGKSVVFMLDSVDEQDALIHALPAIYFITDHYRGYPAVLARLATLTPNECMTRVERAWRVKAPTPLLRAFDAPADAPAATRTPAATKRRRPAATRTTKSAKASRTRARRT